MEKAGAGEGGDGGEGVGGGCNVVAAVDGVVAAE